MKPAPKKPQTLRRGPLPERVSDSPDEFFAWQKRTNTIQQANRYWHFFHASRDPVFILRACECLRQNGIEIPASWLEAERLVMSTPYKRRRGHPAKAEQLVKLGELKAMATSLWPKMRGGELHRWLASEMGLTVNHVKVILSRYGKRARRKPLKPKRY